MPKVNQFHKEANVHVSGTVGHKVWNEIRDLQVKGYEEANWSNIFRRGAQLMLDCAAGLDPYKKIERLTERLAEMTNNQEVPRK